MDRRTFLSSSTAVAVSTLSSNLLRAGDSKLSTIFVSTKGEDKNAGTRNSPFKTVERAISEVADRRRKNHDGALRVAIRGGVYELSQALRIEGDVAANPDGPLLISNYGSEEVVLSGGTRLHVSWHPYRDGIYRATVPQGTTTDQLFVNGRRQVLARYPNFDSQASHLGGTAEDAISPDRVRRWADPTGGYVHAMHPALWGSLHYRILGKEADGSLKLEGGWQIDRGQEMHKKFRFVEGIFEELDAPGEWFLDRKSSTLFFYPQSGVDLKNATIDVVRLPHLVECIGMNRAPVRGVHFQGITFRHTLRTFMETREPVLRSDWHIYRGGALLMRGCEDVTVADCRFDQVGGNAIFLDGYNRRVKIADCLIKEAGASGICCVGSPEAVRSPLEGYSASLTLDTVDRTAGPKAMDFPKDCAITDCLVVASGRVEKQSAGVEIDMASRILVSHCSIYGVPRAGVNIGDGCWGGHRIEHCDVFDTVLETGDHGAFNSWGRDRWWHLKGANSDLMLDGPLAELPTLDAVEPNTLEHNRWACEHGWDIDLDDGSTNYRITNNLCLCGGLKLREGFLRVCENNILVGNTLHVHVWPQGSHDVFRRNVVFTPYRPVRPHGWGQVMDWNLLHTPGTTTPSAAIALQQLSHQDEHSIAADARFAFPKNGDYTFQPDSPAQDLGIKNITPDFGVRTTKLRAIAQRPDFERLLMVTPATLRSVRRAVEALWMGAQIRNLVGLDEVSAFGAPGETGVIILNLPANSPAAAAGLNVNDLLIEAGGATISDVNALLIETRSWRPGQNVVLKVLRQQSDRWLKLLIPKIP